MLENSRLAPHDFFVGAGDGVGMVKDFTGRTRRTFYTEFDGQLDGTTLTIRELVRFDDGEEDRRAWIITPDGDGWRGETEGLLEPARLRSVSAEEMAWRYRLAVPVDGRKIVLSMEDRMVIPKQSDGSLMLVRTPMKKFGLTVGQLTTSYRRR